MNNWNLTPVRLCRLLRKDEMKKLTAEEIRFQIDRHYVTLIATFGLKDAVNICTGVKKRLMDEKKRRHKNERKK